MVKHLLLKPAFTRAVVMQLHQYDKRLVQSDFRIAGVKLTRSHMFLDKLEGQLAHRARKSKSSSRRSEHAGLAKPQHPYQAAASTPAPTQLHGGLLTGISLTHLLQAAGACFGMLWITAVFTIIRDRQRADKARAMSFVAHLRAQYDFNAGGHPPAGRSAGSYGNSVALGAAPLAADWSTMGTDNVGAV